MPDEPTPHVPPGGDSQKAELYIKKLVPLVSANKLFVDHTDLSKFDPSSLQDHYRIDLKDYHLELSHSKQPNTGQDSFVILFTNLQQIREGQSEKLILAYLNLNSDQFKRFKAVADEQIETRKRADEEKKFRDAMAPIDDLLEKVASGQVDISQGPALQTTPPEPDSILPLVDSQKNAASGSGVATDKIDSMVNAAGSQAPAPQPPVEQPQAMQPEPVASQPEPQMPQPTITMPVSQPAEQTTPAQPAPAPIPDSNNLDTALNSAFQPNSNAVLSN